MENDQKHITEDGKNDYERQLTQKPDSAAAEEKEKKMKGKTVIITLALLLLLAGAGAGITVTMYMNSIRSNGNILTGDQHTVELKVTGEKNQTIEVGGKYVERGAVATVHSSGRESFRIDVTRSGEVDTGKTGKYRIVYTAFYDGRQYSAERTVEVADTTRPEITIRYEEDEGKTWITGSPGYRITVMDNYDGDITGNAETSVTENTVMVYAEDSSGNKAEQTFEIPKSIAAPAIEFPDDSDVIYAYVGDEIRAPKPRAYDGNGNDLSEYIKTEGTPDIKKAGRYEVRYFISNDHGVTVDAYRTYIISQRTNPKSVLNENKVIYLTYNGVQPVALQNLLKVLATYGVRATFFLGGWDSTYTSQMRDITKNEQSVGLYSYEKVLPLQFDDADHYFEDLTRIQHLVSIQTGIRSYKVRIPGGSFSGVNSNDFMIGRIRTELREGGYTWYDSTISAMDGNATSRQIFDTVTSQIGYGKSNIVAFDSDGQDIVDATENIIIWGIDNGYTFMPLF